MSEEETGTVGDIQLPRKKPGWPKGKLRGKRKQEKPASGPASGPELTPVNVPPKEAAPKAKKEWKMKARPGGWSEDEVPLSNDMPNRFNFPVGLVPAEIKANWAFQWCTDRVLGQEMPQERQRYTRGGWTPVYQEDFDGIFNGIWMPKDAPGEINVDGLVLMARPMSLQLKALARDKQEADSQVFIKEQGWKAGTAINATGATHSSAVMANRISRTVERLQIPED